jgi:hypothetical protein
VSKQLEVIATRSNSEVSYRRVSDFLASTVFRENEAVLARNIVDDSILVGRDSQGLIQGHGSDLCTDSSRSASVGARPSLQPRLRTDAGSGRSRIHAGGCG